MKILSLSPGMMEFCKARGIAIGPKGGRYFAGSERKDSKGRTSRQYVGKEEPKKEGESLARYSEGVRRSGERDRRLPPENHTLTRVYQGKEVRVWEHEGKFVVHVDGVHSGEGRSLTGALSHALGKAVSGYAFMRLGSAWDEGAGKRDWKATDAAATALREKYDGRFEIVDGNARVLAYQTEGHDSIPHAVIEGSAQDAATLPRLPVAKAPDKAPVSPQAAARADNDNRHQPKV